MNIREAYIRGKKEIKKKKPKDEQMLIFRLCRDYWTRTSDPYVPNVVRYQLR